MGVVFSYNKCWNFGKSIPSEWKGTWEELLAHEDWPRFQKEYNLTDNQIFYIKRGFDGLPFQVEESKQFYGDELMPFGSKKGTKFCDLPDRYIEWLCKQDWLEKWPTVCLYARSRKEELDRTKLSKEEIADIMKMDLSSI